VILTAHTGNNAQLISEVSRLYAPPGAVIADVTYGTGRFWRKTTGREVIGSDIVPDPALTMIADFRNMPYRDDSLDVVVFDPPYAHNSGVTPREGYVAPSSRYRGDQTMAGMYNQDIMGLYREGMTEAFRVLKSDGGGLWVKCKDEVEREVQRWSHIRIYEMALQIGFCARDLFVLVPSGQQAQRWPGRVQRHARKNHSFLWIFQRPDERYRKLLSKPAPGRAIANREGSPFAPGS